jgi:hypothetical protein
VHVRKCMCVYQSLCGMFDACLCMQVFVSIVIVYVHVWMDACVYICLHVHVWMDACVYICLQTHGSHHTQVLNDPNHHKFFLRLEFCDGGSVFLASPLNCSFTE